MSQLSDYLGYHELDRYHDDDYYDEEPDGIYEGFEHEQSEGCCAAVTLWGFPEYGVMNDRELKELESDLKRALRDYYHVAVVMIQTIPKQNQTNKILLKLGFQHTRWMDKPNHDNPENKLRLWWFESDRKRDF